MIDEDNDYPKWKDMDGTGRFICVMVVILVVIAIGTALG